MNNFPKRIKQHKSQSDSFAILLYHLRDLGIFRNATENDYGIDFEIEIVHNERVLGKYLKAQVKSAEKVKIRKDKIPTISGIKESTLRYWIELSYHSQVVAFAVDLSTETIYFTGAIFWQATCLLDGSKKTKTIKFKPAIEFPESFTKKDPKLKTKTENFVNTLLLKRIAFESSIIDIIYAHKQLLRSIKQIFELYSDTWHYDAWTEVQSLDMFKTVLDCAKILIKIPEKQKGISKSDLENLFRFEYWGSKTNWTGEDVSNQVAKLPLKIILPLLLDKMQFYSDLVIKGRYYWLHKDMPYLKLVHQVVIPKIRTHEELVKLDYEDFNFNNPKTFYDFFDEITKEYKIEI